ncbi:MAG: hypothetical protein EBU31_15780, partial [Proteobacteria bacterium]|nr:hypothetical protein [Pseudomonadota bacterium]
YASYYDHLRRAIEDKGTENFPQLGGQKLYGELTMIVTVNHDGRLIGTEVVDSSGNRALDRRAEALLRAVDDRVRDQPADGALQDVLRLAPGGLHRRRDAHGVLDEDVVEERHAPFDARAHAHLVDTHQQELRQSQVQVCVGHPVDVAPLDRRLAEPSVHWADHLPGRPSAQLRSQCRPEQRLLLGLAESLRAGPEDRFSRSAPAQQLELGGEPPAHRAGASERQPLECARYRQVIPAAQLQVGLPARIAPEELVTALADLRHDHPVVARQLRHVVDGHADGVRDRLVLQLDHPRDEVHEVIDAEDALMVFRADPACHVGGEVGLVGVAVASLVADAEGLHRRRLAFGEERRVGGRVDPSREEHPDGDVAHLSQLHRFAEFVDQAMADVFLGAFLHRPDAIA